MKQTSIRVFFTPSRAAQPVLFKIPLQKLERQAGESAHLCCETTKPGACVVWRFGDKVLSSSSKYHLKQEGTSVELVVYKLQAADSGEYSCDTGSQRTSAVLSVHGRSRVYLKTPLLIPHFESLSLPHVLGRPATLTWLALSFFVSPGRVLLLESTQSSSII